MLKFIRGKGQQPSAERQKLQRELFSFRKTVHHGFPNKPTCLAWDPVLRIMAIGTSSGVIKVFGQPGVEFYGHHSSSDVAVSKVLFIPNQGRLITLCEDNSLHLWEINDNALEEVKSHTMEGKLKKISSMCLEGSEEHLLLGTEGGNIYLLNLSTFEPTDTIIYQDVVMQNVPEGYKINPGAVEAMAVQPGSPENVLIGYNRGLIVLWNLKTPSDEQTFVSTQGVESIHWCTNDKFVSSHNDGSYTQWQIGSVNPIKNPSTVFGPFPCKAITKILTVPSLKGSEEGMIIFSGGMQRAEHSERHTITVLDETTQVVFDFTSKVIDFFVASSGDTNVLIVLAEEEIVALELDGEDWPMLELPYLVSLHASSVTCSTHVTDIPQPLWDTIVAAGNKQKGAAVSKVAWPVDGGKLSEAEEIQRRDILLTGHEDGSVRIWDAGKTVMKTLYKFNSTQVMCPADEDCPDAEEAQDDDDWPPFKKVGTFDPYSDDPRLAVKKVSLCPISGTLAVAGTAGHIIISKLADDKEPSEVKVTTMNIVSSRDGFVWKGHEALKVRDPKNITATDGFSPCAVLQLHPPAAITALALHSGWGLVAAGTAHGVALYDYLRNAQVALKCTLNPNDLSGTGDAPISRRKSFKKSLRESFRRLRKGRSQRTEGKRATTTAATSPPPKPTPSTIGEQIETKPVERAIEARPVDDALGSMVRCLTFARTYVISVQNMTPTLWTGTNNGTVYVFTIAIPGGSKRIEESVSCQLGKEIQLKHRAPVIGISLIDGLCNSVDNSRGEDHPPPHKVLICSEEQIKVFTVPQLKPVCKLKLTAGEGARVRRTGLARFKAGKHTETCLLVLTNLGDIGVLSLPDLRRQINAGVARREDINGISSLAFTEEGEALYLHSSSELERVTVSTSRVTSPNCWLALPPGSRPPPPVAAASSTSSSGGSSSSSSSSSSSDDDESHHSTHEKKEEKPSSASREVAEIKENGVSDSISGHDVTLSSVGDITIDSVKDHLGNNITNIEESRTVLTETKLESTVESVVVKTTVITNETTHITSPAIENS